jgi:hypothetical protein
VARALIVALCVELASVALSLDLRTNESLKHVFEMPAFYSAVEDGSLAQYTLIQPRMATSATGPSNWQVRRVWSRPRAAGVGGVR